MPRRKDNRSGERPGPLDRIKKHPVVAVVITLSAITVGIATFTTAVSKINEFFSKEDESPSIRQIHVDLSGQAISLLLDGKLDSSMRPLVSGTPMVWKNDVFNEALELQRTFSHTVSVEGSHVLLVNSGSTENGAAIPGDVRIVAQFDTNLIPELPDRHDDDPESDPNLAPTDEPEASNLEPPNGQLTIDDENWNVAFLTTEPMADLATAVVSKELSADSVIFSRKVGCSDVLDKIQQYALIDSTLLARYMKEGCTGVQFDEIARQNESGCASQSSWSSQIALPRIVMSVVAIENISKDPVTIELEYDSGRVVGISSAEAAMLSRRTAQIGDGVLPPEHALIVPLGLSLSFETIPRFISDDQYDVYPKEALSSGVLSSLATPSSIELLTHDFTENEDAPSYSIATKRIIDSYGYSPSVQPQVQPAFGPVVRLTSLRVNGRKKAAHFKSGDELYVTEQATGGSCPYLYSTDSSGVSTHLGTVLVGRDGESERGLDYRRLAQWPTSATILERDPEMTTLHGMWAVCEHPDMKQTRVPGVRKGPSQFPMRLGRNDSLNFAFASLPQGTECSSFFLLVDGFYVLDTERTCPTRSQELARTDLHFTPMTSVRR